MSIGCRSLGKLWIQDTIVGSNSFIRYTSTLSASAWWPTQLQRDHSDTGTSSQLHWTRSDYSFILLGTEVLSARVSQTGPQYASRTCEVGQVLPHDWAWRNCLPPHVPRPTTATGMYIIHGRWAASYIDSLILQAFRSLHYIFTFIQDVTF